MLGLIIERKLMGLLLIQGDRPVNGLCYKGAIGKNN